MIEIYEPTYAHFSPIIIDRSKNISNIRCIHILLETYEYTDVFDIHVTDIFFCFKLDKGGMMIWPRNILLRVEYF